MTFVHNLLSITGQFTPQPFIEDDIVCLFNGEIYGRPFESSDGEVIIPLYKEFGPQFARHLDGEFAIALYDFAREVAVFATDPFKTKPLFINGVECASYGSGVSGEKALPNTIVIKSLDGRTLDVSSVKTWDLSQFKEGYGDWEAAFLRAVSKRATPGCFIGISSGYDSGGISCAMLEMGIDFKAYCFPGGENETILAERLSKMNHEICTVDMKLLPWLRDNVDNEPYTLILGGAQTSMRLLDDRASLGLATIAALAQAEGRRVMLSGQGADEIMSDYALWPGQSEFKGIFPDQLNLWQNFNFSSQESYLMKEEYVSGAFGIEARYPYLDAAVVQEFLWLSPRAKNAYYKAPLRDYLKSRQFPFEEGVKRGFVVDERLPETLSTPGFATRWRRRLTQKAQKGIAWIRSNCLM